MMRGLRPGCFRQVWHAFSAQADTFPECANRAYTQGASSSQQWQHGLRDLVVKARPDLATLSTLEMEHQLALIDRRHAQFEYLLRADGRRIRTREGLSPFRNFEWTEADARLLRQQSSSYAATDRKVVELERQAQERHDWPALHDYVRTSLSGSPQFQDLLKQLQEREAGIARLLKDCQPSH